MNIIDLGAIDRLVKRNSNLLTSFKIIDDVDGDVAVGNIENSISHFNAKDVVIHNNVVDIVSPDGTISLSYYFSDSKILIFEDNDEFLKVISKLQKAYDDSEEN